MGGSQCLPLPTPACHTGWDHCFAHLLLLGSPPFIIWLTTPAVRMRGRHKHYAHRLDFRFWAFSFSWCFKFSLFIPASTMGRYRGDDISLAPLLRLQPHSY